MYNYDDFSSFQCVKRVLALHDLACFGRSSLVPITAVLSVMGHQCVPVPTAVFSSHMAIEGWVCTDLTKTMTEVLGHFQSAQLKFDAVYSGFLGSSEQIDCVTRAAQSRTGKGIFLVDSVMADNGKLYKTYTQEMAQRMRELCDLADVLTPNVTEAAILLDKAPDTPIRGREEAEEWCMQLSEQYHANVVMTGVELRADEITIACCAAGKTELVSHERLGGYYPGTGDIFASVLLGGLLNGHALTESAVKAGKFVRECIAFTAARHSEPMHGVQFEPLLGRLCRPKGA